jgi:hypothetical protein
VSKRFGGIFKIRYITNNQCLRSSCAVCFRASRAVLAKQDPHGYMIGVTANVGLLARGLRRLKPNELFSIFLEMD